MTRSLNAAAVFLFLSAACPFSALSDSFRYDPHGRRDPFIPLVGVVKPAFAKLDEVTSIGDIKLEGIAVRSGGIRIAILNGEVAKEGDVFGAVKIDKVTDRMVTLSLGGKSYEINLSEAEYGGSNSGS
jgi:hypothetical protein